MSRLLDKVLGIGAGILTLHDIINMNKKTFREEVKSFFQVMEVYGFGSEIDIRACSNEMLLDEGQSRPPQVVDNLKYLRMKALD